MLELEATTGSNSDESAGPLCSGLRIGLQITSTSTGLCSRRVWQEPPHSVAPRPALERMSCRGVRENNYPRRPLAGAPFFWIF
jgi:hypothetical protein